VIDDVTAISGLRERGIPFLRRGERIRATLQACRRGRLSLGFVNAIEGAQHLTPGFRGAP
jgi:hypothetical protein